MATKEFLRFRAIQARKRQTESIVISSAGVVLASVILFRKARRAAGQRAAT